ncbi:formylmethanofuran dehydrogenase subunit B [Methylovorus sp. MM2]|uniref:formylmethanofuran dehydrogenase subunit B n=1 Tax=Methylovorus sp. MM2 TaxID=1848038 RepID=UPI0007DFDE27|nr:formylmethanofuran dehydrogenase subunit B [Methylovorus sp. MM2]OAM52878.1 formylmethanofuran dehydrogenase subunit B [Methylovorus sp. MM2]
MENFAQAATIDGVACPACGLLCDDLKIQRDEAGVLNVVEKKCAKSVAFFERPYREKSPQINGQPAKLEEAIAEAISLFKHAQHPLISGLSTDIYGMRAVMNLAETSNATIDHMNSKSSMRNLYVLQNSGWQITTLTEVRNRVDLLVVVGTDIVSYFSRFFERLIWNQESMFGQDTATREVVYLGGRDLDTSAGISPNGTKPTVLPCDKEKLPEVTAALRALISGKKLVASEVGGIAVSDLQKLADRLHAAKYSVLAWISSSLDISHAELTIQNITGTVEKLNQTTRSSGLPLSGNDGDVGSYNASSWISGYPFRSSYRRDYPDYDPYHYNTDSLLAEQEVDAMIWVNSYNPARLPPESDVPTVVIGHPAMQFKQQPAVFIPIAIPGLDSNGVQFRSDSSVALPLKQVRAASFPTLTEVLSAIEAGVKA